MTPQEMIDVIQAHKDGEQIQFLYNFEKPSSEDCWLDAKNPTWNFAVYNYRIKKKQQKELYRYLIKNYTHDSNTIYYYESLQYFSSIEEAKEFYTHCKSMVIKRLDYTKLIVEE